jgi:LysM repeat protein
VSTTTGTSSGGSAGGSYVVRPGDTLSGIAAQAGTTPAQLAALNGISPTAFVIAGTTLTLPGGGSSGSGGGSTELASDTTGTSSGSGSYVVRPGDTLSGIAAQAGTTVGQLAALNGISQRNFLLAGTTLRLRGGGSSGSGGGSTELVSDTIGTSTGGGSYVVRPGDTLSGIAAQAGTTTGQLAATNGIDPTDVLLAGTTLTLPGGSRSGAEGVSTSNGSSSVANVPTETGSGGPPYPTNQFASASEIAAIANAEGVPPALAEAIGWQESGWNNSVVSNAGAVGVMQIVPFTWQWIGDHLATVPLQPASVSDNIRAGVLLLHALLAQTGSYSQTAAGYYQGLASIRRNGIFPSTQQYVASVLSLMSRFGG